MFSSELREFRISASELVRLKLHAHYEIRWELNLPIRPRGEFSKCTNFTLSRVAIFLVVFLSFFSLLNKIKVPLDTLAQICMGSRLQKHSITVVY